MKGTSDSNAKISHLWFLFYFMRNDEKVCKTKFEIAKILPKKKFPIKRYEYFKFYGFFIKNLYFSRFL